MEQLSSLDVEYAASKRETRRECFFEETEKVVSWIEVGIPYQEALQDI